MRPVKIALLSVIALGLIFSFAYAADDVEKGKALFKDPKFAGGVKACDSCHPNGKGLEKAAIKRFHHKRR
jgi:cytochrome c553